MASKRYIERVRKIAKSEVYASLMAAREGSDDYYELDSEFERMLRSAANGLRVSSARMELDIRNEYARLTA